MCGRLGHARINHGIPTGRASSHPHSPAVAPPGSLLFLPPKSQQDRVLLLLFSRSPRNWDFRASEAGFIGIADVEPWPVWRQRSGSGPGGWCPRGCPTSRKLQLTGVADDARPATESGGAPDNSQAASLSPFLRMIDHPGGPRRESDASSGPLRPQFPRSINPKRDASHATTLI